MAMDLFWAFLVGGALCAVGQVLIDYTKLTPARILTAYVVAGVALSAVGIYPKLVELAGGGASVPLTGFGNLLAEGVRESVDEKRTAGHLHGRSDCIFRRHHCGNGVRCRLCRNFSPEAKIGLFSAKQPRNLCNML